MRDYGKVHTSFWTSDDLRSLDGDGRLLALYLLTGPHTTQLGCFRVPDGYVMEDMGWDLARVAAAFERLAYVGFAFRDDASKWVLLPKFLRWNSIENPNQGKAARKLFEQVPTSSTLKARLVEAIRANVNPVYLTVEMGPQEPSPDKEKNPSETLTQTLTPTVSKPRTGTEAGTEPSRGGANAPPLLRVIPENPPVAVDPETELYRRGKEILGRSSGGLIKQLLKAKGNNVALARAAIETASTKTDPGEYLGGVLKARERDSSHDLLRQRGEAW